MFLKKWEILIMVIQNFLNSKDKFFHNICKKFLKIYILCILSSAQVYAYFTIFFISNTIFHIKLFFAWNFPDLSLQCSYWLHRSLFSMKQFSMLQNSFEVIDAMWYELGRGVTEKNFPSNFCHIFFELTR